MTPIAPAPAPKKVSTLGTMKADGSRLTLHPLLVLGPWLKRRWSVFGLLTAFYVLAPFVSIHGHPALFLDVQHRAFWLGGTSFNSQDVWLLAFLGLSAGFALLFVTAWKGRVWCGWGCPQTVFLESVFRPIERLFDGPPERRAKLHTMPWSVQRVARLLGKYLAYFVAATAIAHALAAILVSPREFWLMVTDGPWRHAEAFTLVTGFSALLLFNFAWFREQFCVVVCPYGRLQSVLHDRHTVTVAYDAGRGEPRGKLKSAAPVGDCIDCAKCVKTCPTGIDIRNGLQMECIACVQCVDACDDVMTRVNRPKGLIRFASMAELAGEKRKTIRPRLLVYGALFAVTASVFSVGLALRVPFESNVVRPRGANPFVLDGDLVRNVFEIHLINKYPEPETFEVAVTAPVEAEISVSTPVVTLKTLQDARVPIAVGVARSRLLGPVDVVVTIRSQTTGAVERQVVRFLAPLGAKTSP